MATPEHRIDWIIRAHRRWIKETSESVLDRTLTWLESDLKDGSLHSIKNIADGLYSLTTYHAIKGVVDVIDGNRSGWESIHRSCYCHLWNVTLDKLAFRRLANAPKLTLATPRVACSLCYAIVCDLDQWTHIQTELLCEMASGSGIVDDEYWNERQFEPFVLRLGQLMDTKVRPILGQGDDFGVYADILTHWVDEQSLADSLVRMCDYHCENMEDDGDWDPEFDNAPFDLIPWELLAIKRVRQVVGLATPSINHPLAAPAVMHVEKQSQLNDDVLTRVETFYQTLLAN